MSIKNGSIGGLLATIMVTILGMVAMPASAQPSGALARCLEAIGGARQAAVDAVQAAASAAAENIAALDAAGATDDELKAAARAGQQAVNEAARAGQQAIGEVVRACLANAELTRRERQAVQDAGARARESVATAQRRGSAVIRRALHEALTN